MKKIYIHAAEDSKIIGVSQSELSKVVRKIGGLLLLEDKPQKRANLDKADIFIVEVSQSSTRAGYVIAYAIATRKPILCLHHTSVPKANLTYIEEGASAKLLQMKPYDEDTLPDVLSHYLRQKKKRDIATTKFTLRVPPSIVEYLNWKKQYTSKSKASIIRDSFIEDVVEKDNKYQEWLSDQDKV
jgi:hypothetical protein